MSRMIATGLAILLLAGVWLLWAQVQEDVCRLLDPEAVRRFLPDRMPMESETIPLDIKNAAALEFPNKSRIALAALLDSGLSAQMRQKYQFAFVAETKVRLDRWNLPAGMVGMGFEPAKEENAPTRVLIARDFAGSEIERVTLRLEPNAPDSSGISFTPRGARDFELRIGKYVVQGTQR